MIVRATHEYARFLDSELLDEFKILFVCAYPTCNFGKIVTEFEALFDRFFVLVAVKEKLALPYDSVFAAEFVKHFVKFHNVLDLKRLHSLLTVAESRVGYEQFLWTFHRNVAHIERDFWDFTVGKNLSVKVWTSNVLQGRFVIVFFKKVVALVVFDYHLPSVTRCFRASCSAPRFEARKSFRQGRRA